MEALCNLEYDWICSKIVSDSPPTLQQSAAIRIAFSFWHRLLRESMDISQVYSNLEYKVQLEMNPECLKNDVLQVVELIRVQLLNLIQLLPNIILEQKKWSFLKDKIFWTLDGTINKNRTAEALADAIDLDVESRFQVAVTFCLEDRVNTLAVQMPPDYLQKNINFDFNDVAAINDTFIAKQHFGISDYVPNYVKSFYKMQDNKNELGCYYFWQRLTEEEKVELTEEQFKDLLHLEAKYLDEDFDNVNTYAILLFFMHCDKEDQLKIIHNERYCCVLLQQLLELQFFPILNACINNALEHMSANSVIQLLHKTSLIAQSANVYKNITDKILKYLLQEHLIVAGNSESSNLVLRAMQRLIEAKEIELVKNFLTSAGSEWVKQQFSHYGTNDWAHLIMASFKCGMFNFFCSSVFLTIEDRKKFLIAEDFHSLAFDLITRIKWNPIIMDDIEQVLTLLLSGLEDFETFKIKLVKERGFEICSELLGEDKWQSTNEFVRWCFTSDEEVASFYSKFFKSNEFVSFFDMEHICLNVRQIEDAEVNSARPSTAIASLIEVNNLKRHFSAELILDICLVIFSNRHIYCYDQRDNDFPMEKSRFFYETLDLFLLAFYGNDDELIAFKKNSFADRNRKLYISMPLEFIDKQIETGLRDMGIDLWLEMLEEFFNWISSNNETFKSGLEDEFWDVQEVLESRKRLMSEISSSVDMDDSDSEGTYDWSTEESDDTDENEIDV